MTVNTTNITSGPYTGNGVTTQFSYTFRIETKNQVKVYETDADGVQTLLTVDTDYTVGDIGEDSGGVVTRTAGALPTGYTWYIRSNYQQTQTTDLDSQGGFFPDVHEAALDKLTFLIQQINDELARSVKLSDSDDAGSLLPLPKLTPASFLQVNSAANGFDLFTAGTGPVTVEVPLASYDDFRNNASGFTVADYSDGQVIYFTDDGIAGPCILNTGVIPADNNGTIIRSNIDTSRYLKRLITDGYVWGDWFPATSTGLQSALDYAQDNDYDFKTSDITYLMTAGITHNNSVLVDLGLSVLDYSAVASGDAWTIVGTKQLREIKTTLRGGWIKGVTGLSDGDYNGLLRGIVFISAQQEIENVMVTGCVKGVDFEEDAFVINIKGCAFWYCALGWNSNQTSFVNMGAALSATDCLFAHNDIDIYNQLCEVQFFNCAFDNEVNQIVQDNITSSGGVSNGHLLFSACRFESTEDATADLFFNSGRMIFKDCLFYEPFVFNNFFNNSGEIQIDGGFTRLSSEFTTSTGGGSITISNFKPKDTEQVWKFSNNESGVYNNSIQLGTTDGYDVTTGTPGDLQATQVITPHSGDYCLRMIGGGGPNIMQSWPIKIHSSATRFMMVFYSQNRDTNSNATGVLRIYDHDGNELQTSTTNISQNTTTWQKERFILTLNPNACYAKFELNLGLSISDYVYMDDFYVNQW